MTPKIVFIASLFTSRIFWAQVIALAALIATAAGWHPGWWSAENQAELVGLIDVLMTTIFRTTGTNGPVTLTAPLSTPPAIPIPPGSAVTVHAPSEPGSHPIVTVH